MGGRVEWCKLLALCDMTILYRLYVYFGMDSVDFD